MAVLRLERQYWDGNKTVYDGIVEEDDDLDDLTAGTASYHGSRISDLAAGSAMYSLESGEIFIMKANGEWGVAL